MQQSQHESLEIVDKLLFLRLLVWTLFAYFFLNQRNSLTLIEKMCFIDCEYKIIMQHESLEIVDKLLFLCLLVSPKY